VHVVVLQILSNRSRLPCAVFSQAINSPTVKDYTHLIVGSQAEHTAKGRRDELSEQTELIQPTDQIRDTKPTFTLCADCPLRLGVGPIVYTL